MTRTRVEEEPPYVLPSAMLFLDDLEEVIRLFREARNQPQSPEEAGELTLKIRVGDWECDTLEDLRALGDRATGRFSLEIGDEYRFHCEFYIYGKGAFGWSGGGIPGPSDESKWALYGRLKQLLEKRKPSWSRWRRATIIFQNSYEYKGILPAFKRHSTTIVVAVITAVLTLVATKLAERLIHIFRHTQ